MDELSILIILMTSITKENWTFLGNKSEL